VHELAQFFIRCCGLNTDVEDVEALDKDGVADAIERIQDENVKVSVLLDVRADLLDEFRSLSPSFKSQELQTAS
jgi:hypothetical protein